MESAIKTAVIFGAVIAAAVAGISIGLSTLDVAEVEPDIVTAPENGTAPQQPVAIDKSRFEQAPEIVGIADYINTSEEGLSEAIEDKVVLYDIWTYSCINCIRTLPYITAWDDKYADQGLLIIGIHSPEFEFEKDLNNVQAAVDKYGIAYPVLLDNDKETWDAFENRWWPRKYVADHEGYIRYDHIGEGAYDETERVIQNLLEERAAALGMQTAAAQNLVDIDEFQHEQSTPELYFGYAFAFGRNQLGNSEGFSPNSVVDYTLPDSIKPNFFYISGSWENNRDGMQLKSDSGEILLQYSAKEVNIVAGNTAGLTILLDGEPITAEYSGLDVGEDGTVRVDGHDLYNLVQSEEAESHLIHIITDDPGFEIFTFTFG